MVLIPLISRMCGEGSSLLLICLLIALSPFAVNSVTFEIAAAAVELLSSDNSNPLFYDCGKTVNNRGAPNLPGLTPLQSANKVITDNNSDTKISGKAIFELSFNGTGIINLPGDDLVVYETTSPEPFSVSVLESTTKRFTPNQLFVPVFTGSKNGCGANVNSAGIDLSSFGIRNGSAVHLFLIDNLGVSGCCGEADISDITIAQPQLRDKLEDTSASGNEPIDQNTIPFFYKSNSDGRTNQTMLTSLDVASDMNTEDFQPILENLNIARRALQENLVQESYDAMNDAIGNLFEITFEHKTQHGQGNEHLNSLQTYIENARDALRHNEESIALREINSADSILLEISQRYG
jgi:hypothetical protein